MPFILGEFEGSRNGQESPDTQVKIQKVWGAFNGKTKLHKATIPPVEQRHGTFSLTMQKLGLALNCFY